MTRTVLPFESRAHLIRTAGGASAEVQSDGTVVLRNADGGLEFVYDDKADRCTVRTPATLRVAARDTLELVAGESVAIEARARASIEGDEVELRSGPTALHFDPRGTRVDAPRVEVRTDGAEVAADTLRARVGELHAVFETARSVVDRAEVHAVDLVERSRHLQREIEEVASLRAGKLRQIVRGAFSLATGRARLRAERDVSIDGSKIELG